MLQHLRSGWSRAMRPPAAWLLRRGLSPDAVTWAGTVAVVVTALVTIPAGWLWPGALALAVLVLTDGLDGEMARLSSGPSTWGAFLDSTLDRVADGAVLVAVALYLAGRGQLGFAAVALLALLAGQLTSYVKARAESVGLSTVDGLASRAERWVLLLAALLLQGLGVPHALVVGVSLLALLGTITVAQRMRAVRLSAAVPR